MIPKGNKNNFKVYDTHAVMLIKLNRVTYETMIDNEDVERIKKFDYTFRGIEKLNGVYVQASTYSNGRYHRKIYLHRWLLGYDGPKYVDHINGNPLDNRKTNLRLLEPHQNSQNRKGAAVTNVTSGIRGVYWEKRKWRVRMKIRGKRIELGFYENLEDAKRVIENARKEYWDTLE